MTYLWSNDSQTKTFNGLLIIQWLVYDSITYKPRHSMTYWWLFDMSMIQWFSNQDFQWFTCDSMTLQSAFARLFSHDVDSSASEQQYAGNARRTQGPRPEHRRVQDSHDNGRGQQVNTLRSNLERRGVHEVDTRVPCRSSQFDWCIHAELSI